MKRLSLTVVSLLMMAAAFAVEKSQTIVVIGGEKFYVHTVRAGETLYSLARTYEVGEQVILQYNPSAADGLKTDERLKIPYVTSTAARPTERKLRKKFDLHTVASGETLYSISRRYAIPIQTVIEDNPGADPIRLHPGEQLLIRRQERGTEPVAAVQAQWEQYRDALNSVADASVSYHLVHTGETFYSIARKFDTTEAQLTALNGGLQPSDLKAGAIIKVPKTALSPQQTEMYADTAFPAADSLRNDTLFWRQRPAAIEFQSLDPAQPLRAALLLPLAVDGTASGNYLDFYQGFLLGLDSVKRMGYSVQLDLYNTRHDPEYVRSLVESGALRNADLIVGPVYEEELAPVVLMAEELTIPVVSPLANLTRTNSSAVFQLAPVPEHKYDKAANLFDGTKKVTLIYSDQTDREFESEIFRLLGDTEYATHRYKYEHASVVERHNKTGSTSASDLTPLMQGDAEHVFVILADNEVDVDRILAALASARTGIISRGYPEPRYSVLGNARWNRYPNLDRSMFFKNRVIFFSTYHAKRDAEAVRRFDSDYIRAFRALPTLYSYRGYDTALLFAPAMFGDIGHDMEEKSYTPLQTTYIFGQPDGGGAHVNQNWTRVNYQSDFTIHIE